MRHRTGGEGIFGTGASRNAARQHVQRLTLACVHARTHQSSLDPAGVV